MPITSGAVRNVIGGGVSFGSGKASAQAAGSSDSAKTKAAARRNMKRLDQGTDLLLYCASNQGSRQRRG